MLAQVNLPAGVLGTRRRVRRRGGGGAIGASRPVREEKLWWLSVALRGLAGGGLIRKSLLKLVDRLLTQAGPLKRDDRRVESAGDDDVRHGRVFFKGRLDMYDKERKEGCAASTREGRVLDEFQLEESQAVTITEVKVTTERRGEVASSVVDEMCKGGKKREREPNVEMKEQWSSHDNTKKSERRRRREGCCPPWIVLSGTTNNATTIRTTTGGVPRLRFFLLCVVDIFKRHIYIYKAVWCYRSYLLP